jgi:hypothetical protein
MKTTADIFIYAQGEYPPWQDKGRADLEYDLEELLGAAGEVTGAGMGETGWNLDLHLHDAAEVDRWADKLVRFLREWGVPDETYLHVVLTQSRRVDVFSKDPKEPQ